MIPIAGSEGVQVELTIPTALLNCWQCIDVEKNFRSNNPRCTAYLSEIVVHIGYTLLQAA